MAKMSKLNDLATRTLLMWRMLSMTEIDTKNMPEI